MKLVCAWCNIVMEQGDPDHVSHGMCFKCYGRLLQWEDTVDRTMPLVPAYGRDYQNVKQVADAWKADKDFLIADQDSPWYNKPANRSDLLAAKECTRVAIRYHSKKRVAILEVK